MSKASVFTISPERPFLDDLVEGLLADPRFGLGGEPAALASVRIFLPTRRACRSLGDAFVRANGGKPLLLPRITPLGDIDEDELAFQPDEAGPVRDGVTLAGVPLAIPALRRQLLLARLVTKAKADAIAPDQALRLAAELARLLDQVHTEGLDFAALGDLVPQDFAKHWQITLKFLAIITEHWPQMLAEEGAIDPADRRNRLLKAQAKAWRERPPEAAVIAAGSTGSIPATAELLAVIAHLPRGAVVLPGLDLGASEDTWDALEASHPQFAMARLLERMSIGRAAVAPWPALNPASGPSRAPRVRLINLALRPSATAHAEANWPPLKQALEGVARIVAPTPQEEARAIALILRETLEDPQRRGMLVTPDRAIARRVAGELQRWGIAADDSAGVPLAKTPPGTFLRLTARMLVEALAPVPLLAALKHPLAACGLTPSAFRWRVRRLERRILRGPRPAPGLAGLRAAIEHADGDHAEGDHAEGDVLIRDTLARLDAAIRPFMELAEARQQPLSALFAAHLAAAETLAAAKGEPGARRLWAGEAGEQALAFAAEVAEAAHDAPPVRIRAYPALLDELMAGRTVRPRYGRHPRLAILGPLEARLISADVAVLAGLNEGTWPARADASPWMSRPMMTAFGLPEPERRVGLAAHDFAQGFCAPEVYLTRAARVERTPTVPSRWLVRLENVVRGNMDDWLADGSRHLSWQALLDRPATVRPVAPPSPCPAVAARPRALSVTQIETWMRDPYSIYARHVLNLRRLEPLDADPSAADYGQFVHHALEAFVRAHPGALPVDAEARLLALGRERLGAHEDRPSVLAFWWPRFERIARWFIEIERERRAGIAAMAGEVKGQATIDAPAGPFTLTARADRIDTLRAGGLVIIDYKTGAVPKKKEVEAGFAPQLPLEAAIASRGGFAGVLPRPVVALEHWQLHGKLEGGERRPVKTADIGALAEEAIAGVAALVARFDLPGTPYPSRPRASHAPKFSDYEHLARVKEWSAGEEASP